MDGTNALGGGTSPMSAGEMESLAQALLAAGYLVQVRDGAVGHRKDSGGTTCLRTLKHRFLVCVGQQACASAEPLYVCTPLVVEPRFREQFDIAHPSPALESLLMALPQIFVGSLARLEGIVSLVADEVAAAFKAAGRPLPPWRTKDAMLSKWGPQQLQELARLLVSRYGAAEGNSSRPVSGALPTMPPFVVAPAAAPAAAAAGVQPQRHVPAAAAAPAAAKAQAPPALQQQQPGPQQVARKPAGAAYVSPFAQAAAAEPQAAVAAAPPAAAAERPQASVVPLQQQPTRAHGGPLPGAGAAVMAVAVENLPAPAFSTPSDVLHFTRRSSSDLSKAASKFKTAKSMLAAALKCAQPGASRDSAGLAKDGAPHGGTRSVNLPASGLQGVGGVAGVTRAPPHEPAWARITTVRWGGAVQGQV